MAMHRFIDGEDRTQQALLPHSLEDYVDGENPVRVIEVFIDELDLAALGFSGVTPAATGRPAYHPSTLLKIYLYGYLNRVQSSRRLEREAQRNGWRPTSRRLPTSARIMARRSSRCVVSLSSFAVGSNSSPVPLLRSTAASSKR